SPDPDPLTTVGQAGYRKLGEYCSSDFREDRQPFPKSRLVPAAWAQVFVVAVLSLRPARIDARQPDERAFFEDSREAQLHQPAVDRCRIVDIRAEATPDESEIAL